MLAVVVIVGVEGLCRLYFAALIGRSVLFYGTPFERAAVTADEQSPLLRNLRHRRMSGVGNRNNSVRNADNNVGSYAKYYPHQKRSTYDVDTGEVYPVTINARGFRGPDFSDEKPESVVRVVSLGASSTFGYHGRDDLTYPAQLEQRLNAACASRTFEVINLAIPHLTSTQIMALFVAEGLPLRPDVVTFYEGFNDASDLDGEQGGEVDAQAPKPRLRRWSKRAGRWLREHFLVVALGDAIVSSWSHRYPAAQIEAHIRKSRDRFLANLSELVDLSRQEGFLPIIASQQARSLMVPREEIRGLTFAQELERVARKLGEHGWLGRKEASFYAHGALLAAEEAWARRHGVQFVDVRRALDQRRDTVVSWVHLSHEGNGMVAAALAPAILDHACPDHTLRRDLAARSPDTPDP